MANLRDLPQELLVLIYHGLGSIEDVHSFGRTYRKAYGTIQRPPIYLNVMRSIIGQAPQHRYDLQLCKMLDLHKDVVEHMQQHSSQLQTTQPNLLGYVHNEWENRLEIATAPTTCNNKCCTNCLPDETIYSILARYQGLRVLETLWLDRQLTSSDYFSLDESPGADALSLVGSYQVTVHRSELFRDGEMPSRRRQTPETSAYTRLNADQRARFYSAVIYVWLLNEIRWVLTNFAYPVGFDVQILLLESCKEAISAQRRVSLLDELDYIAVFKFMYHHLLPVYSTFLADETIAQLPFTFATDFTKDPGYTSRLLQLFLSAGQTYLQPPDLIDLIVRGRASQRSPYPLVKFPTTTVTWQRPSRSFVFPRHLAYDLFNDRCKRLLRQTSLTHLNLIARSSFHQTRHSVSPPVSAPSEATKAYTLRDHASDYFIDRALVAFEMHESPGEERRDIREAFSEHWDDTLWCVWWWANSEEKARAQMERWRE